MKLSSEYIYSQIVPYYAYNNLIIGYSGGIDSHVLLHLLANIPELKHKLTAVYIHHGLQSCADDWAEHCQKITHTLAVKFRVLKVNAQATKGQSPEEAARNARYQAFKGIVTENDVLLFAQHRNDQLETMLLQLFRGAGLKGLSGMPVAVEFFKGMLIRPLLDINQQEITEYAQQHHLQWIEDPSNQDMRFERNYLRQQIIPLLEQRWPGVATTVSRSAKHCTQAQAILSANVKEKMLVLYDPQRQSISISGLLEYDNLIQPWIVREWMSHLELRMPSQKVLTAILHDILLARQDANPVILHDGYHIQRYRDNLYAVPDPKKPDLNQVFIWTQPMQPFSLADNGTLIVKETEAGIAKDIWQQGIIQIKYRQGGEKIALVNRTGRHSLKKLYQEAGIAPWVRDVIPLIYINGELAAIAGYWISVDYYSQNEGCISLFWE